MHEYAGSLRRRGKRRRTAGSHLLLRGSQDAEHRQGLGSIGARPRPVRMQSRKCRHSCSSGSAGSTAYWLCLCPSRLRQAVAPGDAVTEQGELALPRLAVVEHRHAGVADHDQLLLLERV